VTFSQVYDLVLEIDVPEERETQVNEDTGKLEYAEEVIPFDEVETLELKNVAITDQQSAMKFSQYLRKNKKLKSFTLEECALTYDFIKSELSPILSMISGEYAAPHVEQISIDMGYKKFFVSDMQLKKPIIGPYLVKLNIRALFESPNAIADLLKQIGPNYRLSHLTIDYLGQDSFTNGSIQAIQDVFASHDRTRSLKFVSIKVPRELFKSNYDRRVREFDLNQARVFKIEVNDS